MLNSLDGLPGVLAFSWLARPLGVAWWRNTQETSAAAAGLVTGAVGPCEAAPQWRRRLSPGREWQLLLVFLLHLCPPLPLHQDHWHLFYRVSSDA